MIRRDFLATALLTPLAVSAAPAKRRVAVIGRTGRGDYGHSVDTMWQRLPECEVVAVADADLVGLKKAKERLKIDAAFSDYTAMLKETKPEIVAVAPRFVDEHHDMILAAIAAGARGVYVEKPFCRTPAEADAIVAAAKKYNVKIAIAHRNRYHPALPVAIKFIADGGVGTVLEYRGRGKEDHRGGALDLWVLGGHVANLAATLAGPAVACSATMTLHGKLVTKADLTEGAEGVGLLGGDALHARFDMADSKPFYFDTIKNAGVKEANFGVQIVGTKGILDLRIDVEPLVQFMAGNPFHPKAEPRTWVSVSSAGLGVPEPIEKLNVEVASHALAARDLINAIDADKAPLCDAAAGAQSVEMIHAVFESHRRNGERVLLPLKERDHPLKRLA